MSSPSTWSRATSSSTVATLTVHLNNDSEKFIVSDVDTEGLNVGDTIYFNADEANTLYFDIEGNRLESRDKDE